MDQDSTRMLPGIPGDFTRSYQESWYQERTRNTRIPGSVLYTIYGNSIFT
ncbi:hypothetical protein M378DRAFT_17656 [Amanita muscaria Koide BX008]|uniref:Uncharacterized protein n=1 Tax=Amanita muscaria (strain Koide BX008) TaxID=946122 RepID=A0A0C2RZE9_AMAMK|nr:hypothetical protein M378DRAFT_17656 [Amanita muscaria Koide BX008]